MRRVALLDVEAFQELHERYRGVLFATIYNVLNDRQDAEDVAQEVFVQIWKKAPTYDSKKGRPLTWMSTLARNRAIDRLRSKQRRSKLGKGAEAQALVLGDTHESDCTHEVDLRDQSRIVQEAVLRLSPEQQMAIQLAYLEGLTQKEIANRLGEPLGTVKARLRRGLMRLHDIVQHRLPAPNQGSPKAITP